MNGSENINELLAKHFSGEALGIDQQAEVDAYIRANGEEYTKLKKVLESIGNRKKKLKVDTEAAWNRIESRLNIGKRSKLRVRYAAVAVAASLLLIIGIGAMLYRNTAGTDKVHYANNTVKTQTVILPDRSTVVLYPNSSIDYYENNKNNIREVALKGKGFFDVSKQKGSTFIVKAEEIEIKVLGTSFTVDVQNKNKHVVSVARGVVKVTSEKGTVTLEKNERVEISNGYMRKELAIDTEEKPLQMLVFNNTPLKEVVNKLEKQLDVKIDLGEGMKENTITTKLNPTQLDNVLRELSALCGCKCDTISARHFKLYYNK